MSGCISMDSAYLAAEQYPAKQPSDPIEIIMKVPDKPHIVIGDISCRGGAFWGAADAQVVIDAMKTRARAMGGDAIIKYSSHRAPAGTVAAGAYSAEGTVVRWK